MDPMQKLERAIKVMVALFVIAGLLLAGLKFSARRVLPDSKQSMECAQAGRKWDAATQTCLAPQ